MGVAVTLVAVIGFMANYCPSRLAARVVGAGLVALLSTASHVVTNTIGTFWVQSGELQVEVF